MEKTESNKLIAEFMGLIPVDNRDELYWYQVEDEIFINKDFNYKNIVQYTTSDMLPYHLSWDWLMPVVEKIQSLNETKTEFGTLIDISTTHVSIRCKDFKYSIDKISKNWKCFDINNLYKVVIEFIEWYNKQKQ